MRSGKSRLQHNNLSLPEPFISTVSIPTWSRISIPFARRRPITKVLLFTEIVIDEKQSLYTGFPVGSEIFYIQRLHYMDDMPLILNHHYFLKEAVPG